MSRKITVALAGNPNSGKTTLFNALTGSRQHVGNYPGVTVDHKEGICSYGDLSLSIIDLPGTYSLTAYSLEERVARNFIVGERPDVVVNIVDSSNLERNLYLTVQLMELNVPIILAFNMTDIAESRGMKFDTGLLSKLFGMPIVSTVAHKGVGTEELLDKIAEVVNGDQSVQFPPISYGTEIDDEITKLQLAIIESGELPDHYTPRWVGMKLLEGDEEIENITTDAVRQMAATSIKHLERVVGDSPEILIADRRYGFISGACQEAVCLTVEARHSSSDRIDAILTHRVLGLPIFALMMYLLFQLTFTIGNPCVDFLDSLVNDHLATTLSHLWPKVSDSLVRSLIVDGVIGGVGSVVIFVPLIMMLFLGIALLEDTGYMARAAFITDRMMHKIGLHGKSFVPLLIGFGCTVPAIMATRTLESRRDRLTTMMVAPLMSCGARMPIYMLFIPTFFPARWHTPILWSIYVIGIALAMVAAKVLRKTLFKGESTPFVMELPPYRMPTIKGLAIHMWERGWMYLRKAGTIIFALAVVLWACNTFPKKVAMDVDYDGVRVTARTQYLAQVDQVSDEIGISSTSGNLRRAIEAELTLARASQAHWQSASEFTEASETNVRIMSEITSGPDGQIIAQFMEARRKVAAILARYDTESINTENGSPEYLKLTDIKSEALAEATIDYPHLLAPAIVFVEGPDAAYSQTMASISGSQRAEVMSYTISGRIGRSMVPVLRPIGLGNWRIGTALMGALAAKEVFVSQLGIVYSLGEGVDEESIPLREKLHKDYTPLQAFNTMLFCLISAPCLATIAMTKRESGSWKWALAQLGGLTAMAYVICLVVYQIGSLC